MPTETARKHEYHAMYWHLGPFGRQDVHLHPCICHDNSDAQLVGLGRGCDPNGEHVEKKLGIAKNHWTAKRNEGQPLTVGRDSAK